MPSEKRVRQRENRRLKVERMEKAARRRKIAKRGGIIVVIAAAVVGIAYAVNSTGGGKKTSTTTTVASPAGYPCTTLPTQKTGPIHFSTCPKMTIDTKNTYTAAVTTDVGSFTIALDATSAPISVNNFVFLAQHNYFTGVSFHRVIPGFMMQGGDPTGTGMGGPGYEYTEHGPPAAKNPSLQYPNYSVAMANSGAGPSGSAADPGTNGSQFFIVDGTQGQSLPPDYVLFGQVTSGFSVVDKIVTDGSAAGVPPNVTHRIISVVLSVNGKPVRQISTTTMLPVATTTTTQASRITIPGATSTSH